MGQGEESICSVIRVPLFRASVCYDKLHRPNFFGDFYIAKNPSIITKSFCTGTDADLGEIESMTRIKEHPSCILHNVFHGHVLLMMSH